jgi:hypothetical protein
VKRDPRRIIYGSLDALFALAYAIVLWKVIPNRLPLASVHLWLLPPGMAIGAAGMFFGGKRGWQLAIGGPSLVLLLTVLLIARMLISAAFLAGVYGAFGQGAASFTLIAIAIVVELVALLPLVQVKFAMSRAGRRAFGVRQPSS